MSKKSAQRRSDLLDVAIKLIANRGLAELTHRAIDQAAKLPQGSTSYYFPKKNDLLREAAEHLVLELEKDCDSLRIEFADVAAKKGFEKAIDHVAAVLVASVDEARDLFLARIELTIASSRNEELKGIGAKLTEAGKRPIAFFIGLITDEVSDVPLDTYVGLLDGIALKYVTGQGPQPTTEQIATLLKAFIPEKDQ